MRIACFSAASLLLFGATSSCTMSGENRFLAHFQSDPWAEAFAGHAHAWETQGVPELALLASIPVVHHSDKDIQDDISEVLVRSEKDGIRIANLLQLVPIGMGAFDLLGGDEGAMMETTLETMVLNEFTVNWIKRTRSRTRPDGSNNRSFPSGAVASAATGATLAARWIDDQGDGWEYKLGYGLYFPVYLVGRSRVGHGKHWPSDAYAGAFVGTLIANTIYNLHFGDEGCGQGGIFPRSWGNRARVEPMVTEQGGAGISFVFGF